MTWEKFWSIIDRVRAKADVQDEASVNQFLYTELIKLPQDELFGFDCAWQSYRNKANFPKMVAAACIINDGSSDDRFTDFRNWLIMQGYDAYRQAGKLMKMAIELGKPVNPKLHVGICGEHGGDPSSVEFCNSIGLDYVSCSPFRVPIARLAAAQAAIAQKNAK